MTELVIQCDADGCETRLSLPIQRYPGIPNLPAFFAGLGWRQFFNGPVLCPLCLNQPEALRRFADQTGILPSPHMAMSKATQEPLEPLGNVQAQKDFQPRRTDEEILAAVQQYPIKSQAARSLGMKYQSFWARLKTLNETHNHNDASPSDGSHRLNGDDLHINGSARG